MSEQLEVKRLDDDGGGGALYGVYAEDGQLKRINRVPTISLVEEARKQLTDEVGHEEAMKRIYGEESLAQGEQ